jgi:hypothetical protein
MRLPSDPLRGEAHISVACHCTFCQRAPGRLSSSSERWTIPAISGSTGTSG